MPARRVCNCPRCRDQREKRLSFDRSGPGASRVVREVISVRHESGHLHLYPPILGNGARHRLIEALKDVRDGRDLTNVRDCPRESATLVVKERRQERAANGAPGQWDERRLAAAKRDHRRRTRAELRQDGLVDADGSVVAGGCDYCIVVVVELVGYSIVLKLPASGGR